MLTDPQKIKQIEDFISSCFEHPDRPLHWISGDGFIAITEPPFERQDIINVLGKMYDKKYVSQYSYSKLVLNRFSSFYNLPLFKQQYWEKIYTIKASLPLVKKKQIKHNRRVSSDHVYQLLLDKPLIPSYAELVALYQDFIEGDDAIPFDYASWLNRVPDKDLFMKAIDYYNNNRDNYLRRYNYEKKYKK